MPIRLHSSSFWLLRGFMMLDKRKNSVHHPPFSRRHRRHPYPDSCAGCLWQRICTSCSSSSEPIRRQDNALRTATRTNALLQYTLRLLPFPEMFLQVTTESLPRRRFQDSMQGILPVHDVPGCLRLKPPRKYLSRKRHHICTWNGIAWAWHETWPQQKPPLAHWSTWDFRMRVFQKAKITLPAREHNTYTVSSVQERVRNEFIGHVVPGYLLRLDSYTSYRLLHTTDFALTLGSYTQRTNPYKYNQACLWQLQRTPSCARAIHLARECKRTGQERSYVLATGTYSRAYKRLSMPVSKQLTWNACPCCSPPLSNLATVAGCSICFQPNTFFSLMKTKNSDFRETGLGPSRNVQEVLTALTKSSCGKDYSCQCSSWKPRKVMQHSTTCTSMEPSAVG